MSEVVMLADFAGCMCRECGALCGVEAWEDRDGLCGRCAHRPCDPRNTAPTDRRQSADILQFTPSPEVPDVQTIAFINGREVIGDDPIRRAIEAAARNLLEDLSHGNA